MISIILPCYNSGEHLKYAIDSIIENTKYPYELILVESESTDNTGKVCDEYASKYANIKVLHTHKKGITNAINCGIREAGSNDIYLTQDDVILPKLYGRDWLEQLVKISERENCGVVSTKNAGSVSGPEYLEGLRWVGTWSLFIPRKTINKVGVLDEGFSPGPGDDIDYTYRVMKAGLEIYESDFMVDHHRRTENFNDNIEFIKRKNAGYFKMKHGLLPYWHEFEFDGEKFLLDFRTVNGGGCFNAQGTVDSPETCRYIKQFTKDFTGKDMFIDIGANTGLMSLMIQDGQSLAIEPTLETFGILKNNIALNMKNIISLNLALSDKEDKYIIQRKISNPGENKIEFNETGTKTTKKLDNLGIENMGFDVKLIKIDTEGHDGRIIKGGINLIKKYKPVLIVEHLDEESILDMIGYTKLTRIENNTIYVPKNENGGEL